MQKITFKDKCATRKIKNIIGGGNNSRKEEVRKGLISPPVGDFSG